jgi:hypothetical protein
MAEFLGIVLVFGFFVGLWRAGFNAGLAWLVIIVLAGVFFWPLAAVIALVITGYGVFGSSPKRA